MRVAIIILLFCVAHTPSTAQGDWHLKRDERGIKVFTRNSDNSNFKTIKVECNVNATRSQLVTLLFDIDHQGDWVCNYKSSRMIRKVSDSELIFYSEIAVPWPAENRDYVSHVLVTQPGNGAMVITATSEPGLEPKKSGKVRIIKSSAHWNITSLSPGEQHIDYMVEFDPAGSLPAWLVNMFITKAPFETFYKLRKCLEKPQYQNVRLAFIRE